jgi:hypothetical protein
LLLDAAHFGFLLGQQLGDTLGYVSLGEAYLALDGLTREIGQNFMPPKGSPSRSTTLDNGDDSLTISVGDQSVSIPMGNQTTTAAMNISTTADISITLTVGPSVINITPGSISLESPVINLVADGAVNIVGSAVNIAAVLNTPELNAGAATVSGIPL